MSGLLPHNYLGRANVERMVGHLWRCGPRAVAEFLEELSIENGIGPDITRKLRDYQRIDPDTLAALCGDRFATSPVRAMP